MSPVVLSLLAALLSLAIRHIRVWNGLVLATMTSLVASEIALRQEVDLTLSKSVAGLTDRVVTILTARQDYG